MDSLWIDHFALKLSMLEVVEDILATSRHSDISKVEVDT
jgi:hypothetical protein